MLRRMLFPIGESRVTVAVSVERRDGHRSHLARGGCWRAVTCVQCVGGDPCCRHGTAFRFELAPAVFLFTPHDVGAAPSGTPLSTAQGRRGLKRRPVPMFPSSQPQPPHGTRGAAATPPWPRPRGHPGPHRPKPYTSQTRPRIVILYRKFRSTASLAGLAGNTSL